MGFFRKSFHLLSRLTPINSVYLILLFLAFSFLVGAFASIEESILGFVGTFIALFSGLIFSFSFLMFEASKKKKEEIEDILKKVGVSFRSFKKTGGFLSENKKYNQADIFNRLRFIEFADNLFTLIIFLVIVSIIIFISGISLGITFNVLFLIKYQNLLHRFGLFIYSFLLCFYIWIVAVLIVRVYRFYMFEIKL